MAQLPVWQPHGEDDSILNDLMFKGFDIAVELAHSANDRIIRALSTVEIARLKQHHEVWQEFVARQMDHERRLFGPFRDTERAVEVASAVHYQLKLAKRLDDKQLERVVVLVRKHGFAVREIALALAKEQPAIVMKLRLAFREIEKLIQEDLDRLDRIDGVDGD